MPARRRAARYSWDEGSEEAAKQFADLLAEHGALLMTVKLPEEERMNRYGINEVDFETLPRHQRMVIRFALADQARLIERVGIEDYYTHVAGSPEEIRKLEETRASLLEVAMVEESR